MYSNIINQIGKIQKKEKTSEESYLEGMEMAKKFFDKLYKGVDISKLKIPVKSNISLRRWLK